MNSLQEKSGQRGSILLMTGIAAVFILSVAALVFDVGQMMVTRAELQNVADSAASSANLELGHIYEELGNVDPNTYTLSAADKYRIYLAANRFAHKNQAAHKNIWILPSDMIYATWDRSTGMLTPTDTGVTAVAVLARRDENANGVVSTLMASMMGVDDFASRADAATGIAPVAEMPSGKIDFPVGIARAWFESKDSPCGGSTAITLYPTGTLQGCAGWHTFVDDPANAEKLKTILHAIHEGHSPSPEVIVGQTEFNFTGGTVDAALQEAKRAFEANRGWDGTWQVHLPVYDRADCSNPQGWVKIVGIATATITKVDPYGGDKQITANVECDVIGYGKGGGPDYGTHVGLPMVIE